MATAKRTRWKLKAGAGTYGWYAGNDKYKGGLGKALGVDETKDKDDVIMGAPIPAPKLRLNGENNGATYSTTVYCAPSKLESAMKELIGDKFTAKGVTWKIRSVGVVKG